MPSDDLLLRYQDDLAIERQWRWNGQHYEKTCNAWLVRHDAQINQVMQIMEQTYGTRNAKKWSQRWRVFYMACAELFGYANGNQWWVSHYLFRSDPKT